MNNNVAVIGGGASGLTAAIAAAEGGAKVSIYEGGSRVGKKILQTGNGRCNMTNINADISHYHGNNAAFIKGAVNKFWINETIEFFRSIGVVTKTESEGRVYPLSDRSSSVLDALRFRAQSLNVNMICDFTVNEITKKGEKFIIKSRNNQKARADRVILATGGMASPSSDTEGGGYKILESLGHSVSTLRPSLVQIKTEPDAVRNLKGVRQRARVTINGYGETGEVQFTDYGLSGIVIFNIAARLKKEDRLHLDLMPDYSREELRETLLEIKNNAGYLTLDNFLMGVFNKKIAQALLKETDILPMTRKAGSLTSKEINRLCDIIKKWEFKIKGTMSWNKAQVTRGGAVTKEFDPGTMESKIVRGLYACGEVMDIDGDCGGYNLQWAFASGHIAGECAAKGDK